MGSCRRGSSRTNSRRAYKGLPSTFSRRGASAPAAQENSSIVTCRSLLARTGDASVDFGTELFGAAAELRAPFYWGCRRKRTKWSSADSLIGPLTPDRWVERASEHVDACGLRVDGRLLVVGFCLLVVPSCLQLVVGCLCCHACCIWEAGWLVGGLPGW